MSEVRYINGVVDGTGELADVVDPDAEIPGRLGGAGYDAVEHRVGLADVEGAGGAVVRAETDAERGGGIRKRFDLSRHRAGTVDGEHVGLGAVDRQCSADGLHNRDGCRLGRGIGGVARAAPDEHGCDKQRNEKRDEVAHQTASLLDSGGGRETILLGAGWSSKILQLHAGRLPMAANRADAP